MTPLYFRGLILLSCALVLNGCASHLTPEVQANRAHCKAVSEATKAEDYERVLQQADLCLEKNQLPPSIQSAVYSLKANAYASLKRFPEALVAKEKAVALEPTRDGRSVLDLSAAYRQAGNPGKALELVQSNLDSGLGETGKGGGFHMPTFYHLGLALSDLGQYREAAEAFSTGLLKQPDFAWAYYFRGIAYDKLGNREDARSDFSQFAKRVEKKYVEPKQLAKLAEYSITLP